MVEHTLLYTDKLWKLREAVDRNETNASWSPASTLTPILQHFYGKGFMGMRSWYLARLRLLPTHVATLSNNAGTYIIYIYIYIYIYGLE